MVDTTPAGLELLHEGAAAHGRGEVTEALRIFDRAARTTTGGVQVSAMINAASMRDELGDHSGAIDGFRAALAAIADDAIEKLASTLINYSQALQHIGQLDDAQRALERARDLLTGHEEFGTLRVSCLVSLTAVATHRGQWVRAIQLATESLDTATHFAPQLRGHPLGNLAVAHFESGHGELGLDFARQALAAFEAAGDVNAAAESRQNLAQMYARLGRDDEAEPSVRDSQRYFEQAGLGYRAGVGLSLLGLLAERHGDLDRVERLYRRALEYFETSGAVLDAAGVRIRLATLAFAHGHAGDGETLIAAAYQTYAERGLGLQCARVDFWHASLWDVLFDDMVEQPPPELVLQARDLAVTAAIAIDAVRYSFANGAQREQWNREMAAPALRLAFRLAHRCGDGRLIADLIETQCAGTTLDRTPTGPTAPPQLPFEAMQPPADPDSPPAGALHLGAALAQVAAAAGLPVSPPPRLTVPPDGHIALDAYITAAEQRYGRPVREERVLPT